MTQNRAPVVDKTMLLLGFVATQEAGASLSHIAEELKVARSTVYRILNSLIAHRFVVKDGGSRYKLGPRIVELARNLAPGEDWMWLIRAAAPVAQQVASQLGEACKITVREGDEVVTIHSVTSPSEYGLAVRTGHRSPLYAGGSAKAVLAFLPQPDIDRIANGQLAAFTPFTITDGDTLRETLSAIRAQGYAEDAGEMTAGVRSFAAPIFDASGGVIAAISVPFIGDAVPERARAIRQAVMDAARRISSSLNRT